MVGENMEYIIDQEINFEEKDYLNSKQYSNALKEIIDSSPKNKVFTVGLFGGWGTGKSSIIKTTEELYKDDKSIKFVKYDAWQYVNDSFRRMFLRTLQTELDYEQSDLMKKFYENRTQDVKVRHKITIFNVFYILIGISITIFSLKCTEFDNNSKIGIVSAWTLLSTVLTIGTKYFDSLKVTVTEPMIFAPEQFTDCYNEIIEYFFKKRFNDKLKYLKAKLKGKDIHGKKLIIVIDNIDRCQGETAYSLLSDLKTFLGNQKENIVFLIPVDDNELKKQIFSKTISCNDDNDIEEFLRKSFNTVLRIKPFAETDMYEFAKKVAKENKLNFNDDVVYLASKKYAKNPRRIVQLYNNLLSELAFYDDKDFVEKNQALICICLILREEYFDFYNSVINSPSILNTSYDGIKGTKDAVNDFLLISRTIIRKFDIAKIEKVLTNTNSVFTGIPGEICTLISNFNSKEFITAINNISSDSEKDNIYAYLVYKVTSAISKRNNNEISNLFTFIAEINKEVKFSNLLQNFDGQFIKYGYESIIENSADYDALCCFIEYMAKQGFDASKTALITVLQKTESDTPNKELFDSAIKYSTDKDTAMKLSKTFELLYENNGNVEDLTIEQYDHLILDECLKKRIENIKDIQSLEQNQDFFAAIFEHKTNYDKSTLDIYLGKIKSVLGSNQNKSFEKLHEEMVKIIAILNPFVKNYSAYKNACTDKKGIRQIYEYFFSSRVVNGSNKSYLNEIANSAQYSADSLTFIKYVYILAMEEYFMQQEYQIVKSHREELLNIYYELLTTYGLKLSPLIAHVLDSITSLDTSDKLKLYEHCCFLKENDNFVAHQKQISAKYDYLFDFNTQKEGKEKLILKLCAEQFYSESITDSLIEQGEDFVNSLPQSILSNIIKVFTPETHEKYKTNYKLLSIIVKKGTEEQKRIVVNIIINNIHNRTDISQSLGLIEIGDFESNRKQELISALRTYKNEENVDEELEKRIDAIIGL